MSEIAEYVTAAASLGALGAAVWAGMTARGVYRVEQARDLAREDERKAASATLVTAWSAVLVDPAGVRGGVVLHNGASTPIYDVEVASNDYRGQSQPPIRLNVAPPGQFFVERDKESEYHWLLAEPVSSLHYGLRPVTKKAEWAVTELVFTDAAGRRWERDVRGILARHDAHGPSN